MILRSWSQKQAKRQSKDLHIAVTARGAPRCDGTAMRNWAMELHASVDVLSRLCADGEKGPSGGRRRLEPPAALSVTLM